MAYNTDELEKQALAAIKKHKLVFIEDVVSYLPCTKPTFYEHNLNESDAIKKALTDMKVAHKVGMRKKWLDSDNPTLQIAYYKMIATENEFRRLTSQNIDHTTAGEKIDFKPLYFAEEDEDKPEI